MEKEVVAAVYPNTMCETGVGDNADEIWKKKVPTGWLKCASLHVVQSRIRYSVAVIYEILYCKSAESIWVLLKES